MVKERHLERREITKTLSCHLDRTELLRMGQECARLEQHIRLIENEKKEKVDEYNGRIKATNGQMERLCACIRSRTEERLVRCEEGFDFDKGVVYLKRLDTKEKIEERPMQDSEAQQGLDYAGAEEPESGEEGNEDDNSSPAEEAGPEGEENSTEEEGQDGEEETDPEGETSLEEDLAAEKEQDLEEPE
jgi:hypothetical protein